ncbi:toll/interleukin-1 receptor domain-containing protein [Colwellia psychrerythraea]|uniref:TIR protein n=1 Tax=Colwellia psychrerythraea TaxID=28229 RepID=A0A099KE48_COLPS|nr:toll/interleukin-1 receptor domain-containing protein [Colwellia psychrerythraea]KGJ88565.1 TIR protein [Colwellia psychrerythraea]
MGQSVLVFVSHSSDDKEGLIEPLVQDLEDCYINVWLDKRKILPGDNLRKSIFRDGLDKADVALIFFTEKSLKSSWVDREIKHVLREESKKGNDFDLNKIISIFDCEETYNQIAVRYPELTDDLLHLMPENYNRIQIGQLISAIWSKYLSLQGGDVETQRQLLTKEKEIFQQTKDIEALKKTISELKSNNSVNKIEDEFLLFFRSGKVDGFINAQKELLAGSGNSSNSVANISEAVAFGLVTIGSYETVNLTQKGRDFFKWYILNNSN